MCLCTLLGSGIPSNSITKKLVNSICDDINRAVTRGKIETGTHTILVLSLKSMTESRLVIEIFNYLGHCLGYNTIEAQISDKREALHNGLTPIPDLGTLLAWNNYNEFLESLSGGGMITDTVGSATSLR